MKLTNAQIALWSAERAAHFYGFEQPKPAVTTEINGITFEVAYNLVNRKCYDGEPTPTLSVKVNGKRMAWAKAMALLA